jgi:RND family efflux transporter MFP subunit
MRVVSIWTLSCRPIVCAVATIGLLAGCDRKSAPPRPPTTVGVVITRPTEYARTVAVTGEIAARVSSDLSFRVSGRIRERKVDVGDHVVAGQVLAMLDPEQQQAGLAAAQANVQSAEATVSQTASAFERQEKLMGPGFTTRREHDQAEQDFHTAQSSLDAAKAQLGMAQDQLDQTTLVADKAGVITARAAEAGQVVQAAQAVYTLAQDGPRDAVFNVDESTLARKPDDTTVHIALVTDPKIEATARLREISPVVDPVSGTVRMKFEVVDPPAAMGLGAPVTGSGHFTPRKAIILPWTALTSENAKPAVWVVNPSNNTVSLRQIDLDAFETELIVVRGGLEPGQMVVSRGAQLLHPNQVVTPVPEPKS